MADEMTVEEFRARGLRIPKPKKPDLVFSRFVDSLCLYCLGRDLDLPTKEHRFAKPDREWRFDLCWPRYRVAFEREGGTWGAALSRHTTGEGYRNDCEKYSEASLRGWCVIRATTDMLRDGTALLLLSRALEGKAQDPMAQGSTGYGGTACQAPPSPMAARPPRSTRSASKTPTRRPRRTESSSSPGASGR